MTGATLANLVVMAAALASAAVLFLPRLQRADAWRATVTPLASIIGSGFLVLAPLLLREFGRYAVWAMTALCASAYAVGGAIRFNIRSLADAGGRSFDDPGARRLDQVASWTLVFAYVVSVAYYLNLFGAFAVKLTPWQSPMAARIVTSSVLVLVASIGWWHGLRGMERAEGITVSFKLAVIAGLLAGLVCFALRTDPSPAVAAQPPSLDSLRLLLGLVITVQGFETSRYLGEGHDADTRIRTMRYAQWASSAVYLVYIGLVGAMFDASGVALRETEVIDMMRPVASVLPALLVAVALAAQFSAAVADTNGAGGLVEEMSQARLPSRLAYVALAALALALTWSADIFRIISYASRAFAAYYALQSAIACRLAWKRGRHGMASWFGLIAVAMLLATLFGIPAE